MCSQRKFILGHNVLVNKRQNIIEDEATNILRMANRNHISVSLFNFTGFLFSPLQISIHFSFVHLSHFYSTCFQFCSFRMIQVEYDQCQRRNRNVRNSFNKCK